jgi:mitogen-activated protein kinase organizer 1
VDGRVRVYDIAMGVVDTDVLGASVTSVVPAQAGDCYLVGTLDSKLRVMDRSSGKCLQTCKDDSVVNETYRLRSCFAAADALVASGTEDGRVMVWDVLTGEVRERLWHKREGSGGEGSKRDVVSAVAWNQLRKQWASAGGDGTVVVWGAKG